MGIHAPDDVVVGVGDVEVPRRVDGDPLRPGQLRLDRQAAVPAEAAVAGPGDRGDDPGTVHRPDGVVVAVGEVEEAVRAEGEGQRLLERGLQGGSAVAGQGAVVASRADRPAADDRVDQAIEADGADAVVGVVDDEEVAGGIGSGIRGAVDVRLQRGDALAGEAASGRRDAGAGDDCRVSIGVDQVDVPADAVGDDQVAVTVEAEAGGLPGGRCRGAGSG